MKRNLTAAFAAALAMWLFSGWISYSCVTTLSEHDRWVAHTHEVLTQLTEVLSTIQGAETGQRGYLLTGRDEYLRPYGQALSRIEDLLDRLELLIADNPRQQDRLTALRRTIRDKLDMLAETVALRGNASTGFDDPLRVMRMDRGLKKMDEIRDQIATMHSVETRLLGERAEESRASARAAFVTLSVITAVGEALLGLLSALGWRELQGRQRVAEDLHRAKQDLEMRVRDRTAELAAANVDLIRQVEERGRAEEEARRNEQRYRSLVEATTAIVWNMPASGEFEVEQAAWSAFTGQDFGQLKAWGWLDAVHPEDRAATASAWSAAVAGRSFYQVEHRLRRHDGEYRHMSVRAVPIVVADGSICEWVGVHTDVDTQKRAEVAQREAKEAAEAASRSKSEFLASMSHEIRTPMNGILGMTHLLLDLESTARQREYLEMVKTSADDLLIVINDLLDFSKIEAGKVELDQVDFNLHECVGDTLKLFALRAHKKGLELACRIRPGVPETVAGDPGRFRQILINLVGNAIKFTERGEVVLTVSTEASEGEGEELRLHFTVWDTGIGIPAGQLQSIFDSFTQGDGSVTRKYGGTGLGLSISSRLVELMDGRLWVESEVGKGSTFHFTARFARPRNSEPRAVSPAPVNLENVPVLVVDDNATNRLILEEMVMGWRMKPTTVEDGRAALVELERAAASGDPFPLVLLDAHMPEMDGFEVARQIRRRPQLSGATILMLSSVDQQEDPARSLELGLAGHLVKPVRPPDLHNAICTALGIRAMEQEPRRLGAGDRRIGARPPASLRILVAEDNDINQVVVLRMLELEGHRAEVVGNGKEALAALERQPFDLVLMDVQMPEMSGFEATAAIRASEKGTDRHLPVIALTAYAVKGDRERCLAAGMDAYLSKPILAADLHEAIGILVPPTSKTPLAVILDRAATLDLYRGDLNFVQQIAMLLLKNSPRWMAEIQEGISRGEAARVGNIAHKLAGAVSSFVAPAVTDAARKLLALANSGDLTGATDVFNTLEENMTRLVSALADLVAHGVCEDKRNGSVCAPLDSEVSNPCIL